MFSLPARPPGLTAPIGPDNLPDWQASPNDDEDESPQPPPEFHSLEDIAPLQKTTDELPGWLVDKIDSSDPGFEPPKEITTDHFMELLRAAENDDTDHDIAEEAAQARLPDWLQNVMPAKGAEQDAPPQSEKSPPGKREKSKQLPDSWLTDIDSQESQTIEEWDQSTSNPEIPDWLTDFTESSPKEPEEEPYEDEEAIPSGIFDMSEFSDQVLGGANLPDWMDFSDAEEELESQPLSGIFQSAEFAQEVRDAMDSELPDWLAPDSQQAPDSPSMETASTAEDFSGWFAGLDSGEPTKAPDKGAEPELPEADSGWLNELEPAQTPSFSKEDATDEDFFADAAGDKPDTDSQSPDWLNELGPAYTAQLTPSTPESEEAPDWLAELGPPQTNILPDSSELPAEPELAEPLSDIFTFDKEGELMPDWLDDAVSHPREQVTETPLPPEFQEDVDKPASQEPESSDRFELAESEEEIEPDITYEAEPDWLDELSALGPEAFTAELSSPVEDEVEEPALPAAATPGPPTFSDDEIEPVSDFPGPFTGLFDDEIKEAEEASSDVFELPQELLDLGEEAVPEGEFPEWLTQLGLPPANSESSEYDSESDALSLEEQIFAGELPEWVASMRPDTKEFDSSSPGLTAVPLLEDDFAAIPEDLEGANLPDWLEDAPGIRSPRETAVAGDQDLASDIPEWLQFKTGEEADLLLDSQVEDVTGELSVLLEDLPPARDPAEDLVKADLPDWIKAMKPKELTPAGARPGLEEPVQEIGPLSGIRGVIEIEPTVATPHTYSPVVAPFTITTAQQEQATLLRQIQAGLQEQARTISKGDITTTSPMLRLVLAVLLLAAIFTGLLGPNLQRVATPSAGVEKTFNALQGAAGQHVIVAFEYTPAMAAELDPQASVLLDHLAQNGSSIITVSQYAAGLTLAQTHTADYSTATFGFIPGEAIGLRELSSCLQAGEECLSLAGHPLDADVQAQLNDVALIIVLTGERSSLINWIEQVGAPGNLSVVAGTTQALAPVAAPYAAAGQLQGVIGGLADAAMYAQLADTSIDNSASQLNAQHLAQWVTALLLLLGALITLFTRKKQA